MRLVYFGTGPFAVPALERMAEYVALVVAQPDRPAGRGMKLAPTPVKLAAERLGLPVETPEKARDPEFVARIEALAPDALLVASYGQILSLRLLGAARCGGINLHGSLLPKYRGAAPIQRAILEGETTTGITLMQMAKGMDTGDMIAKAETPIGPDETSGELFDRLAVLAADLAEAWMPRIVAGEAPRIPQDDALATHAAKIEKAEAELDPRRSAGQEYDRFRAFTPAPGAFLRTVQGSWKLSRARRRSELAGEPGTVVAIEEGIVIAFSEGAIEILELQPEGKKRMSGRDIANGSRLRVGDRLVSNP